MGAPPCMRWSSNITVAVFFSRRGAKRWPADRWRRATTRSRRFTRHRHFNDWLVGGLEHLFSIIYGNNNPSWLSYFQRGRYTTNHDWGWCTKMFKVYSTQRWRWGWILIGSSTFISLRGHQTWLAGKSTTKKGGSNGKTMMKPNGWFLQLALFDYQRATAMLSFKPQYVWRILKVSWHLKK